jgi:hypothetical protein
MALLFCDGFGHIEDGYDDLKYTASSIIGITYASTYGSDGGYGIELYNSSWLRRTFASTYTTLIVGVRFNLVSFSPTADMLAFYDSTSVQIALRVQSDGSITVHRGTTEISTSATNLVSLSTWYYVEMKIVFSQTVGTVDVELDGTSIISDTAEDTCNTANAYANGVQITAGSAQRIYVDDLYVCDDSGTTNNAMLGDIKITTLYPTSDSATNNDFTPSTGSDNYALVDDPQLSSFDTDYVESSTVGHKDTYGMTTYSETGTILGVQVCSAVKNTDTGTMAVRNLCRSGTTPTDNEGSSFSLSQTEQGNLTVWEEEPTDTTAWTTTNLNNAEFGLKVQS